MKKLRRFLALLLALLLLCGCAVQTVQPVPDTTPVQTETVTAKTVVQDLTPHSEPPETSQAPPQPDEDGEYTAKEDVAQYLVEYGRLPANFITKKEAQKLGWPGGDLTPYAPGKSIGGDRFGNREGILPEGSYHECDIDYHGGSRGARRLVYSDDGRIYYTEDHYAHFELLYGEE